MVHIIFMAIVLDRAYRIAFSDKFVYQPYYQPCFSCIFRAADTENHLRFLGFGRFSDVIVSDDLLVKSSKAKIYKLGPDMPEQVYKLEIAVFESFLDKRQHCFGINSTERLYMLFVSQAIAVIVAKKMYPAM